MRAKKLESFAPEDMSSAPLPDPSYFELLNTYITNKILV